MVKSRAKGGKAREVAGPRSLTRLLALFDVLARAKEGLSLAELNTELRSPKSSLLNLLRPLVLDGYLSHDNGRYRLGTSAFRLAANIMAVWNFSNTVRPYLEELAVRSQESVYLGVLDRVGKTIVYVDAIESPQAVRFSVPVGAVRPLYSTAAGRVLLAFVESEWLESYLSTTKLEAYTARTVTSKKELHSELEQIRTTKISVSLGELFAESAAIAAPVFGADGRIMAAIAIGAPVSRLKTKVSELSPIIADIAERASGTSQGRARPMPMPINNTNINSPRTAAASALRKRQATA